MHITKSASWPLNLSGADGEDEPIWSTPAPGSHADGDADDADVDADDADGDADDTDSDADDDVEDETVCCECNICLNCGHFCRVRHIKIGCSPLSICIDWCRESPTAHRLVFICVWGVVLALILLVMHAVCTTTPYCFISTLEALGLVAAVLLIGTFVCLAVRALHAFRGIDQIELRDSTMHTPHSGHCAHAILRIG